MAQPYTVRSPWYADQTAMSLFRGRRLPAQTGGILAFDWRGQNQTRRAEVDGCGAGQPSGGSAARRTKKARE
ncbi:hypothetical protein ABE38_05570 [Brevibacillus agri]|nr:hypothetical protein [Brevibacillus agri]